MFHLLGFLFIIFIAVLVIGLSIVGSILRVVFGFGRRRSRPNDAHRSYRNMNQTEGAKTQRDNKGEEIINMTSGNKHPKFFSKEDGEYVDFEEINE